MLPGVIQVEGMYYVKTSGRNCGSGMITEASECEAAATALGVSDTSVTTSTSRFNYPQGCTDSSGYLYIYENDSGSCTSTKKCICKFSPPSPPAPATAYFIVYGPCTINGTCVRSPNYPSNYGNGQSCTITPEAPAVGLLLSAIAFETEQNYDKLIVNGVTYSGTTGPSNVLLESAFTWSSDNSVNRAGWEVCAQAAPPTLPPSPPLPPSSPSTPPGYLKIAGGYYMIESGSCGGALILTTSECNAAATALNLDDKTASDYTSSTSSSYASGCQLSYSTLCLWCQQLWLMLLEQALHLHVYPAVAANVAAVAAIAPAVAAAAVATTSITTFATVPAAHAAWFPADRWGLLHDRERVLR